MLSALSKKIRVGRIGVGGEMGKEIEVYNAYFGDCVILKDGYCILLVDFGIHYNSPVSRTYGDRSRLMDSIAEDIASRYSRDGIDLLITHFHEDHVSGLVHMLQSGNNNYMGLFKHVYIANIWDNPFAVASSLLEKMIVEMELKMSGLPRTTASLLDVLNFIASNCYYIKLLSRGVTFEGGRYITLWPDKGDKANDILDIIKSLSVPNGFAERLLGLSDSICTFVKDELLGERYFESEESYYKHERFAENVTMIQSIENFRNIYDELFEKVYEYFVNWGQNYIAQKEKLNKLNHKYNIVFQDTNAGYENVLFTGDVEALDMAKIANDVSIKLHTNYKYIKIPHHGTENHFFDFSKYDPEVVIITNGKVTVANANAYKICTGYGGLKAQYVCANSNHCCNCISSCRLATNVCNRNNNRILVYSKLYKTT